MTPQIKIFPKPQFIGQNLSFTYADYRAYELWSRFMPRLNEIQNAIGTELYNIQINPVDFDFNPNTPFVKWAARAVTSIENVPSDMEVLVVAEGLYAVFHYQGDQSNVASFFNQIYTVWLPSSGYKLDSRPQFDVLGEKYKNNNPYSEEEIWIPIKKSMLRSFENSNEEDNSY